MPAAPSKKAIAEATSTECGLVFYGVGVGQVWECLNPKLRGRRLVVFGIEPGPDLTYEYGDLFYRVAVAVCRPLGEHGGRQSRIRTDLMHRHSRGYRLVEP